MLIALQFPITDFRWLLGLGNRRVSKPFWPYAKPENHEFVRSHGSIKYRFLGGIDSWSGEDVYAQTKSGIKLGFANPRCVYRRFFYDGYWNARYEFGFIDNFLSEIRLLETEAKSPMHIWTKPIKSILDSSVWFKNTADRTKLYNFGNQAIDFFLDSTTIHKFNAEKDLNWAFASDPILVAELGGSILDGMFPSSFKRFAVPDSDILLIHFWTVIKNRRIKTWLISNPSFENSSFVRALRLNLMRLHSEKECLKRLFWGILTGLITIDKHTEQSELVQKFLTKTISKLYGLNKSYRDKIAVKSFQIAHDCDRVIDEGGVQSFYSAMEAFDFRPNIARQISTILEMDQNGVQGIFGIGESNNYFYQIENFTMSKIEFQIGDGNVFKGPFVVAERVKNSFNNAQNGTDNAELRGLLKDLVTHIAKLQENLNKDEAEAAVADTEAFVNEAIRENPRKSWLATIGENIKSFASKAAAFALPIVELIDKIISMIPA